ncbi:hypothetical protein [Magnetospirillum sp. 15-1]|uniref:hypothetical protein n=1 Tax=Magnetospirillum sp. 15-1 TaxID=1979370 RepID=UPI001143BE75|nr:hypothetical protein [Magnetospirillum sp. 15-1]
MMTDRFDSILDEIGKDNVESDSNKGDMPPIGTQYGIVGNPTNAGNSQDFVSSDSQGGGVFLEKMPSVQRKASELDANSVTDPIDKGRKRLAELQKDMGFINRVIYNKAFRNISRKECERVAELIFRAEFESICQQLTLNLDIEKKKNFIEYMRSSQALKTELQVMEAESRMALSSQLFDVKDHVYEQTRALEVALESRLKSKRLRPDEYQIESANLENIKKKLLADSEGVLEEMWRTHMELLVRTLALFYDTTTFSKT